MSCRIFERRPSSCQCQWISGHVNDGCSSEPQAARAPGDSDSDAMRTLAESAAVAIFHKFKFATMLFSSDIDGAF